MSIENYFNIFDFDCRPTPNNLSRNRANGICVQSQSEYQGIVDRAFQNKRKDFDYSKVPTGFLMIRLKSVAIPDWWDKEKEVYRVCNCQQWEKAVADGKTPEQIWSIEKEFPINLPCEQVG